MDNDYPDKLRRLENAPLLLYVIGELPGDTCKTVGIVGTRKSCRNAEHAAFEISYKLSEAGCAIISGGAYGIDKKAHSGALQADGETVCVLGCGFDAKYLMSFRPTRKKIEETGAVISEYPPEMQASYYTFPNRNRIISGLSDCVLVVEAGESSGSLITAEYAVKQHRKLFAIPSSLTGTMLSGTDKIIKQGACAVNGSEEILQWFRRIESEDVSNYNDITDQFIRKMRSSAKQAEAEKRMDSGEKRRIAARKKAEAAHGAVALQEKVSDMNNNHADSNKKTDDSDRKSAENIPNVLTGDIKAVYDTISGTAMLPDEIEEKLHIGITNVLSCLTELAMLGFCEAVSGGKYRGV